MNHEHAHWIEQRMPPYIAPEVYAAVGYWGVPSSTLDWCEENHAWSPYVAEFCMYVLKYYIRWGL